MPSVEKSVGPAGAVVLPRADGGIALLSRCWQWRYRTGQNENKNSPDTCSLLERASTAALVRHGILSSVTGQSRADDCLGVRRIRRLDEKCRRVLLLWGPIVHQCTCGRSSGGPKRGASGTLNLPLSGTLTCAKVRSCTLGG